MKEETVARIEQYLNGELSENDRISFEKEIQIDSELQKQVEFMRLLPKAVRAHTEMSLKNKLKEIEAKLPNVKFESEESTKKPAEPPIVKMEPRYVSSNYWMRYAVAASVLLVLGLFLFKDEIFKTDVNQNQVAQNGKDTVNQQLQGESLNQKQIAFTTVSVTRIEDGKFGFVKNGLQRKLVIVHETDSTILKEPTGGIIVDGPRARELKYGLYRLISDTLFLATGSLETSIQVFDLDVKAQRSQMIDSSGQMIEYDKPALQGLFIFMASDFFKIIKTEKYAPLVVVKKSELGLLKYYTTK